jgi:hypothetical protein
MPPRDLPQLHGHSARYAIGNHGQRCHIRVHLLSFGTATKGWAATWTIFCEFFNHASLILIYSCRLQGFYKHGRPVFPKFLPILATLEISQRAQISSASVLFVHLKLVDCDTTGSPFHLAHDFYRPYFPLGGIEFCEMEFDVATGAKSTMYQRTAAKHIRELLNQRSWARLVVGITNHTDNETGDPFAGFIEGKYISGEVQDVSSFRFVSHQALMVV